MTKSSDRSVPGIVSAFVDQLAAAVEAVATELARVAGLSALGAGAVAPSVAPAPSVKRRRAAASGNKREPAAIAAAVERLAAHIAKHPGQGMEEIVDALGVSTKDLALPIRKLIASKRITKKGQKRATKYFPAQGPQSARARKTVKKRKPRAAKTGRKAPRVAKAIRKRTPSRKPARPAKAAGTPAKTKAKAKAVPKAKAKAKVKAKAKAKASPKAKAKAKASPKPKAEALPKARPPAPTTDAPASAEPIAPVA